MKLIKSYKYLFFISFFGVLLTGKGNTQTTFNLLEHVNKVDQGDDYTQVISRLIQQAAPGDTVYIPEGKYQVSSIRLKSGVHLKSKGQLIQRLDKTEDYTNAKQTSSRPLIHGSRVNGVYISVNTLSQHEGIALTESSNIIIDKSNLKGDSTKLRSFAGIILFNSKDVRIHQTEISYFGTARQFSKTYQPGTGIRILSSTGVLVKNSYIHHNGENGVFMHGSRNVEVSETCFRHNGMSGIQVAFGSTGLEKNFKFTDNVMEYNAADAIDINNRSSGKALDINCYIHNNTSLQNGYVRNESTPDGSGIATLINVSNVIITSNKAFKNNRPALYLESCGYIQVRDNEADNQVELTKELEKLELIGNTFGNITLLSDVKARQIMLEDNSINNLHLPNGVSIDSLKLIRNQIRNAALNFNMRGNVMLLENKISSQAENVAIWIVTGDSFLLEKNDISSFRSSAVFVRKMASNVIIRKNRIRSADACLTEDGSPGLLVEENELTSLPGGENRHTLLSTNPRELMLIRNLHTGVARKPALVLEGEGSATLNGEKVLKGKSDFGKVKVIKKGQ
jgi:parallel beta-helix repeat protein